MLTTLSKLCREQQCDASLTIDHNYSGKYPPLTVCVVSSLAAVRRHPEIVCKGDDPDALVAQACKAMKERAC